MTPVPDSRPNRAGPSASERDAARDPELSSTVEGGWGATLPGAHDAGTTSPGPMAITNVPEPRPTTHPPGMITTLRTGMSTAALGATSEAAARSSRADFLTPGTIIDGKYRLEELLGKGGMGIVWRAEHAHLHGSVAIKFLLDRFRARPQVIERFRQEATVMGELGHPNIVRVYDISSASSEMPYITMELLSQGSLREHLKRSGGTLPPDEACELMDGVLSALIAAHKRGIVHRDIKPDNLMLATVRSFETDMNEVQLKILDFGASLLLAETNDINNAESLMGTPYYMSPEQASGAAIDQRSDLYSTAVVLYELISGKLPHSAEELHSLVYCIAMEEPTPIATYAPNLPRPFREFFHRALAQDRGQRFETAEDMRQAMRGLSRRLAGKNRNTALHMATGDTGPMQSLDAGSQTDAQLRSFREALDGPEGSSLLGPPPPSPPPPARPFAPIAALAAVLATPLVLTIQWARFGGLGRAPGLDTSLVWVVCAGAAVLIASQATRRR